MAPEKQGILFWVIASFFCQTTIPAFTFQATPAPIADLWEQLGDGYQALQQASSQALPAYEEALAIFKEQESHLIIQSDFQSIFKQRTQNKILKLGSYIAGLLV